MTHPGVDTPPCHDERWCMQILSGARLAAVLVTLPLLLATVPATAEPQDRHGHHHAPRRSGSRRSTPRSTGRRGRAGHRPVDARRPAGRDGRRDHPADPARRPAAQRVRLRRRAARRSTCSATTTSRSAQNGARPIDYRYAFIAPSNTGIPSGFDLNNNGTIGGGDDAFGFGVFPGQFGMAVLSQVPDRPPARADLPELPLGGHARRDAARRPGHARAGRLVLARGARRLPAVEQVALGPADPDRPRDRALPGLAPDPAGLRRRRGPQRHPQLRRDPVLGRLRVPASATTCTTTRAGAAGCARARGS